ncbi:peptidyl-prolyl cis-trans isomerase [Bacillus piscicola]|uniref:peptidyl-prolyl cis-trans isomerase n=1 Tax=Bacillus piscicola TaxID=1632684 RepID=UPI001F094015|nr:peptidyl-prolyl cis-trans isomerase [Bacillus piscicola]
MEFIVLIHGKTKHQITIDPTVWIFDDRKIDLKTWEGEEKRKQDDLEAYTKSISKQWDKEMIEGAQIPRSQTNKVRNKKEALINGTFGIPFGSFIENADPNEDASKVAIETINGDEYIVALEEAKNFVIGFSKDGAPLRETGPVHVYYGDARNKENPITGVKGFRLL